MWHAVELSDAEHVRLVLDHRRLVVIDIEVIRRGEKSHDARESRLAALSVHAVPICNSNQPKHHDIVTVEGFDVPGILCLMGANDGQQAIPLEKVAHGPIRVKVGAAAHVVVHKVLRGTFLAEILDGI